MHGYKFQSTRPHFCTINVYSFIAATLRIGQNLIPGKRVRRYMPKSGQIFRFAVYHQQALDRMIRLILQHANAPPLRNHTVDHRTMSRTWGHVAMRSLAVHWTGFWL